MAGCGNARQKVDFGFTALSIGLRGLSQEMALDKYVVNPGADRRIATPRRAVGNM
jgi:hypothetical protein